MGKDVTICRVKHVYMCSKHRYALRATGKEINL